MPRELPGPSRPEITPRFRGRETLKKGPRVIDAEFDETDEEHERQIEQANKWIDVVESQFARHGSALWEEVGKLTGGSHHETSKATHEIVQLIARQLMPVYRGGLGISPETWEEAIKRRFGHDEEGGAR